MAFIWMIVVAIVIYCASCSSIIENPSATDLLLHCGKDDLKNTLPIRALNERNLESFPIIDKSMVIECFNILYQLDKSSSFDDATWIFGRKLLGVDRERDITDTIYSNPKTPNTALILRWMRRDFGEIRAKPVTVRRLALILNSTEVGLFEIAQKLLLNGHSGLLDMPIRPSFVNSYANSLMTGYIEESPILHMWIPDLFRNRSVIPHYVNLTFTQNRENIQLHNLINNLTGGERIVFYGKPGIGKTCLMYHLAKEFTKVPVCHVILKLHLSDVNVYIDSLETLLNETRPHDNITNIISKFISSSEEGASVCFLLDGYDMYYNKFGTSEDFIAGLFKSKDRKLKNSIVVMTSRSGDKAMNELIQKSDITPANRVTIIDIRGFEYHSIKEYLKMFEIVDDKHIRFNDFSRIAGQFLYSPLHLTMMVSIITYEEESNVKFRFNSSYYYTESALYRDSLLRTLKRNKTFVTHMFLNNCFDRDNSASSVAIPYDPTSDQSFCVLLRNISEIAYECMISGRTTFNLSSLQDSGVTHDNIQELSLFQAEKINDDLKDVDVVYHFSHHSFQEFLAALHLTMFSDADIQDIMEATINPQYTGYEVFKFYFGLIGEGGVAKRQNESKAIELLSVFTIRFLSTHEYMESFVMKCVHEFTNGGMQYVELLENIGVISSNSLDINVKDNFNCWYIGYAMGLKPLQELQIRTNSDLAFCLDMMIMDPNMQTRAEIYSSIKKIVLVNFTPNKNTVDSNTKKTSEFLKPLLQSQELVHLEIFEALNYENIIEVSDTEDIFPMLECFSSLIIDSNNIAERHLQRVINKMNSLDYLNIDFKVIDDHSIPGDLLANVSHQVRNLSLSFSWNNKTLDYNLTALIEGLQYMDGLRYMSFFMLFNGFKNSRAIELRHGIQELQSIDDWNLHLDLCNVYQSIVNATMLSNLIETTTNMTKLTLCTLFNDTAVNFELSVLTEGLRKAVSLVELNLEIWFSLFANNIVGFSETVKELGEGLLDLKRLTVLRLALDGCCSEIKELLPHLQELKLKCRCYTSQQRVKMINLLKKLRELKSLNLSGNGFKDEEMVYIAEVVKKMPLHTLDLSNNSLGDYSVRLFIDIIDSGSFNDLTVLALKHNDFSVDGAKSLSEKIVKLKKIQIVDLDKNEFGMFTNRGSQSRPFIPLISIPKPLACSYPRASYTITVLILVVMMKLLSLIIIVVLAVIGGECSGRSELRLQIQWGKIKVTLKEFPDAYSSFQLLKGESSKWYDIGRDLKVCRNFRESLKQQPNSDDSKLEGVLAKWIETNCSDVTWDNMIISLHNMGLVSLAIKIITAIEEAESKQTNNNSD